MIQRYLGTGAFWRVSLKLAIPIALQNLLISSFGLVDTLMVGQLGDIALSSVGIAGQWAWLMNIVIFGICSGSAIFISQYWGIKDIEGIRKIKIISCVISLGLSLPFFLSGSLIPRLVLRIFTPDVAVIDSGSSYLFIASFSYVAIVLTSILSVVLRSTENVRLPMVVSSCATLLNVVMNYTLIFGKFGFPELGVKGAAIATTISAWGGLIVLLAVSLAKKNILFAGRGTKLTITRDLISEFFRRSIPVTVNESMWGLGTFLYNIIFANLGYEYYAAVTIQRTIENVSFAFFIGLCSASCIMVGKSVGSGKITRAVEDARRFAFLVPAFSVVIGLIMIAFRVPLVHLFNMSDNISELTVNTALSLMTIFGLEIAFRNIPYITIVGIFRPGGDTMTGVKYDLVVMWLIALPATLIAAYLLKLPFVWVYYIMYASEDYVKSFLCLRHFKRLGWIKPVTDKGREGLLEFERSETKTPS